MRASPQRLARGRVMRLLTRVEHARLQRAVDHPAATLARPLLRWLGEGEIAVANGIGCGLVLGTREIPVTHAQAGLLARGTLEPAVQEALRRTIGVGATVLDVGANLGFFSLLAGRLAGPDGCVVAFEPVSESAAAARANVRRNAMDAIVTVREEAVGVSAARAELLVVADASWSKLASLGAHPDTAERREVAVVGLDELRASGELPVPDVVKLDAEGAEVAILEGMRGILERDRPDVICEVHDTNSAVAVLLEDAGYRVEVLEGPGDLREAGPGAHVLARAR